MSAEGWSLRIFERGAGPPREVPLRPGLTLGRSADNDCVIDDEHVGRHQLRVVEAEGALCLEELGSSNPTRFGGRTLAAGERVALAPRLSLEAGRTRLEVLSPALADDPDATLAPRAAASDPDRTLAGRGPQADPERTLARPAPAAPPTLAPRAPAETAAPDVPAAPAVPARPAGSRLEPAEVEVGGSTLALGGSGATDAVALRAFLETRRARLVLAGEVDRRAVAIDTDDFVIGREVGACLLSHPAVSARHARIRANVSLGTFQVEDLGSGNGTYLNGAALTPGIAQALLPESHLRFGPIDALFTVALDAESQPIAPALQTRALALLVGQGLVGDVQASEARTRAGASGGHLGEALILASAVKVGAWRNAFESARLAPSATGTFRPPRSVQRILLVLAVIAILVWLLSTVS